ncbi:hypothetical protein BDP27DRAFT_1418003 [Rhodocollybia butyracea]|uniref:Ubiquitin-like domain-containing protein n=1 Tax=Rhodocollybia butyracea TaxID=206335 RepID=A0A9P5Q303_9AGAR|nr:hypothetical protein BDP27DRAFT_1418003 [Rhodocollybia butyracea]
MDTIMGNLSATGLLSNCGKHCYYYQDNCTLLDDSKSSYDHHPSISHNVVLLSLALFTAAIPIASTLLNASINALLAVLQSISTRRKNREDAAHLTRHLYHLDHAISATLPAPPSILQQRNELARRLNAVLKRLKKLHVRSVLRSADIKQAIQECIGEIDEHLQLYSVISLIQTEAMVQMLFENQGRFPISVQQDKVFVRDATGREYKVLAEQCWSHKQFMRVLASYFEDTNRDEVLRGFINQEAYELYIKDGTDVTQLERWGEVQAGTRIIMTAVSKCAFNPIKLANTGVHDHDVRHGMTTRR